MIKNKIIIFTTILCTLSLVSCKKKDLLEVSNTAYKTYISKYFISGYKESYKLKGYDNEGCSDLIGNLTIQTGDEFIEEDIIIIPITTSVYIERNGIKHESHETSNYARKDGKIYLASELSEESKYYANELIEFPINASIGNSGYDPIISDSNGNSIAGKWKLIADEYGGLIYETIKNKGNTENPEEIISKLLVRKSIDKNGKSKSITLKYENYEAGYAFHLITSNK